MAITAGRPTTTVHLMRHGQTDWNVSGRWQGQLPTSLNEHGHEQARHLAEHVRTWPLSAIYTSDLPRAQETAKAVAEMTHAPLYTDVRWREIGLGELEGLTIEQIEPQYPGMLKDYHDKFFEFVPPHGEARRTVQSRALAALDIALDMHAGEAFAVVSHGVTLRVMLMGLLPAQAEHLRYAEIGNASITTLHHNGATWELGQLSFVGHLGEIPAVRGEAATW